MTRHKIISQKKLPALINRFKKQGKRIVFTNGTFDILHVGHITYLEKAKRLGDILLVGINSDQSVRSYKGPRRPINSESERLRVLGALACVDYAILFGEETPLSLILKCRPDVLVKGADWKRSQIVGAREVESWGGKVKRISYVPNRSTTRILKKLKLLS